MPIYKIRGIDIDFPFEAYDCQIVYMEKVIQSLQERSNALLESPTGTGKTLCLLCATLAWRKSLGDFSTKVIEVKGSDSGSQTLKERADLPTIIYTSRTHSQLKQVIRELKLSNYRPKMTVLGSREQLCIHKDVQVLQGRARDKACNQLCKKRSCSHHNRVSDYMKQHPELGNEPFDIEDLVNVGRSKGPCPYYVSRELHKVVDIIFAPYNYLIDPRRRGSLSGISWGQSVLIFDEAHNLEGICADAASFDLPSSYLASCISEAKQCVELSIKRRSIQNSTDKQSDPDQYAILRALLSKLEKHIGEVSIESKELGFTRPGPYIYEFLSDLNITLETADMLISTVDDAVLLIEEDNTLNQKKGTICRLEGFKDILQTVFRDGGKGHAKFYRFHVQESQQKASDFVKGNASRTLSWWCFNPGIAMQEFTKLNVCSVILTSGTLSPLDSFAVELNMNFPVRLENPHVVSSNQVWAGVISSGPSGKLLNSSFRNRDSLEYKQELGNAIVNFARVVPDGLLVFFPSYYLMEQCIDCWKSPSHFSVTNPSTIWERICKNKQPVVEPKQSALFANAIEDFKMKLCDSSASGAIFFAVCRGKVSEGLDFADRAGRAVVITGMPFAMRIDPKVRLKREYLDRQSLSQQKNSKVLTGEEWYVQQASRAVNQAVGRVIRHQHDYGAIIFCDERFCQQNYQNQMSYWLRPYVKCYSIFGDAIFKLTRFFRDQDSFSQPNSKKVESLKMGRSFEKIVHSQEQSTTLNLFNHSVAAAAEDCPKKPLSSTLTSVRCSVFDDLSKIIPANRSNISNLQMQNMGLKQPRHLLCVQKRLLDMKRKSPRYDDCQAIDLTSDKPMFEDQEGTDNVVIPCSFNKSKLLKVDSNSLNYPKMGTSENMSSLVKSENSANKLSLQDDLVAYNGDTSQGLSCKPSRVGISQSNKSTITGHVSLEMVPENPTAPLTASKSKISDQGSHGTTSSCGHEDTKGSAFLVQVQEKLSASEYKDFIGLMKALKSKTMKIVPVLESIIKLFSTPGRTSLLKRFKEYIPVKYHPFYENHIRAHDAATTGE